MPIRQALKAPPKLTPDIFSYRDEFVYKELCYKTKAFAEQVAQSMNLIDEKRSDYILSIL